MLKSSCEARRISRQDSVHFHWWGRAKDHVAPISTSQTNQLDGHTSNLLNDARLAMRVSFVRCTCVDPHRGAEETDVRLRCCLQHHPQSEIFFRLSDEVICTMMNLHEVC
jgi:hypothetical protein